jgi:hypothetical protein
MLATVAKKPVLDFIMPVVVVPEPHLCWETPFIFGLRDARPIIERDAQDAMRPHPFIHPDNV